jgi:small conductance mechanosensitive channel
MTSLRDLEGVLHFIPHSQVSQVSNLTYGWSRIVVDIRVAPGENVDRAMSVLMQVAHGLAEDPEFGPQLVGEPEMLGVDSISGAGVVIKLLVKTQPLRRWAVKRELLLRIKRTFDAQTIRVA